MPRTARASGGGHCYHVINRGNVRAEVFHKDGDYDAFVHLLADAHERLPMRVLAYCLMSRSPRGAISSPGLFIDLQTPRASLALGVFCSFTSPAADPQFV